ncbi:hypothetical protein NEOKW01_0534 [Nematocida sp. AWRm80]|nr:hypothetical protein NEOKW01_0534 [Nematocida sp. AWRm80]
MKVLVVFTLMIGLIHGMAIQKIFRPKTTTILTEKIQQVPMTVTVDVNVLHGNNLYVMCGMKNTPMSKVELVGTYKPVVQVKELGEFELHIINESNDYTKLGVSIYVDKPYEDTDEAEVLRKLLEKVRIDLMNIYNDILKLKNMNTQSLLKAKSAKSILWFICVFPILYILLSYIRLNSIKGFFSNKKPNKI